MSSPFISHESLPYSCHNIQAIIDDYLVKAKGDVDVESDNFIDTKYIAYKEPNVNIFQPALCSFVFMSENELKECLNTEEEYIIIQNINSKMAKEYPKGIPRQIFISMMYNVFKYCKKSYFDIERTGVVVSTFYLTHIYTTSKFDMTPHKVFSYFKELFLYHVLPFPPFRKKIFTHKETRSVLEFFYKIYLRNLPLLRMLCLPNFSFSLIFGEVEDDRVPNMDNKKAKDNVKTPDKKSKSKSPSKKKKKGK